MTACRINPLIILSAWSFLFPAPCQDTLLSSIILPIILPPPLSVFLSSIHSSPSVSCFGVLPPIVNWISLEHHLSYWFRSSFSVFAVTFSWDMLCEEVFLIHSASINWINYPFLMTQSNVLSASSVFSWPLFYLIFMDTWEERLSKGKAIPSLLEYL